MEVTCFLSQTLGPTVVGYILGVGSRGDAGGSPLKVISPARLSPWCFGAFEVGRKAALPGVFFPPSPPLPLGPPSICIAGLMVRLPPVAELSACHASGPPEDDKRAFCLQALSFLLWGDPSRLREEGGRQTGEGEEGSLPCRGRRMLPGAPPGRTQVARQLRDKAYLGTGRGGWEGGCPGRGGRVGALAFPPRRQRCHGPCAW